MNKLYPTKEISSAWLVETDSYSEMNGIKNIIGITINYDNDLLFYSIFDDCFFRVLPSFNKLATEGEKNFKQVFAETYSAPFNNAAGMALFLQTKKAFLSIEEILANKDAIRGYYSDLDYGLSFETKVDYENSSTIDENVINSVRDYTEKKKRPITYDKTHILGPQKTIKKS